MTFLGSVGELDQGYIAFHVLMLNTEDVTYAKHRGCYKIGAKRLE